MASRLQKRYVNFNKSHYIKLLQPKNGKQNTLFFALKCLFTKLNLILTRISFKFIYFMFIDLKDYKRRAYITILYICYFSIFLKDYMSIIVFNYNTIYNTNWNT